MNETPRALVIVFDGVEEIEALTPVDILRRAEVDVTLASVDGKPTVTGRNRISFSVDAALGSLDPASFDVVVLPGGPGVMEQIDHPGLRDLLVGQARSGRDLAALCAAPKLLAHHGLLADRKATSHSSVRDSLPHAEDAIVVEDGNLVTSQGLGTAVDFSLALVKRLVGPDAARSIAKAVHFPK